jgi:Ca2+-binding RTX toxin-like protein
MSLSVSFGNGGAASVVSLTASSSAAYDVLNGPIVDETETPTGSQMPVSVANVGVAAVEGSGTGGNVGISYDTVKDGYVFDVQGDWNTVKNVYAFSKGSENLTFKDFVHVDVVVGGTSGSNIEIANAKRGNVTTGDGNDSVKISLLTNDGTWANEFNVNTGAGNDTIVFNKGDYTTAGDGVGSWAAAGTNIVNSGKGINDGSAATLFINAGAGIDTIDLSQVNVKQATIVGGTGADRFFASSGKDIFVINQGDSVDSDIIKGFDATKDKLDVYGATSDWSIDYFQKSTYVTHENSDGTVDTIVLSGVDLSAGNWLI